jgi:hypothetical protein
LDLLILSYFSEFPEMLSNHVSGTDLKGLWIRATFVTLINGMSFICHLFLSFPLHLVQWRRSCVVHLQIKFNILTYTSVCWLLLLNSASTYWALTVCQELCLVLGTKNY